ncbi:transmembrane protein 182-like [Trichomycterus rosablanca]|uniref:transmembrane protein 182-like n=1 Tax=Trichomycterus rosablanca TaxID=2290929 RepID=UPI002F352E9C
MKISVAALIGGLLGVTGVLCFLLAFATDYWLLVSENCGGLEKPTTTEYNVTQEQINSTEVSVVDVAKSNISFYTLHHEGFFWHCLFHVDPSQHELWAVLFTNQPELKQCTHGYLFPLPVVTGPVPYPLYDTTAVFRGYWTIIIILGIAAGWIGGFLLVCAVPFISHKLYRVGGAFLITSACLFLVLVSLFVLWYELVDVRQYILQERGHFCPDAELEVHYGWSFMVAAAGIPLVLVSGLLFFLVGKTLQEHTT